MYAITAEKAMEDSEFEMLIPRAVIAALRMRKKLEEFRPKVYLEHGKQKIGYAYSLSHGISETVASNLMKERLHKMGQALMRRAFETNFAADSARFGVFVELAERVGETPVLDEKPMWDAVRQKDYWGLHDAFLTSSLITAYGDGKQGRLRVGFLSRVLVEGEAALKGLT